MTTKLKVLSATAAALVVAGAGCGTMSAAHAGGSYAFSGPHYNVSGTTSGNRYGHGHCCERGWGYHGYGAGAGAVAGLAVGAAIGAAASHSAYVAPSYYDGAPSAYYYAPPPIVYAPPPPVVYVAPAYAR